ncbi:hypothetical protein FOCC_FOCC002897 [Frankliniella occidentalis]|nr:hypothetical protein FOCC_FOCC002897 [Frankliniella occidentalis]
MDLSSDEETTFTHRKSSAKKIFDSDEETDEVAGENLTEATEDFKLHLSDDEDEGNGYIAARARPNSTDKIVTSPNKAGDSSNEEDNNEESNASSPPSPILESGKLNVTKNSSQSPPALSVADDIRKKLSALADSESESDVDGDLRPVSKSASKKKSRSKNKQGSDSDSDPTRCDSEGEKKAKSITKGKKPNLGPERKSKTNAKSAMLEIKAESQRQLRQSNIGLPYHVPKQRSLLDFLNRRKSSSPMPIKGPTEQLVKVWKQIEEREREVEEFYKSESEHESDSENGESTQDVGMDGNTAESGSLKDADTTPSKDHLHDKNINPVNSVVSCEDNRLETTSCSSEVMKTTCEAEEETSSVISDSQTADRNLINKTDEIACDTSMSEEPTDAISTDAKEIEDGTITQVLTDAEEEVGTNNLLNKIEPRTDNVERKSSDAQPTKKDVSVKEATAMKVPKLSTGPRLSLKGAPDELIDLDDMSSIQSVTPGVKGLIERFMKHSGSKKKNNRAQTVELSVISSEKDNVGDVQEVKHESIKIVLSGDDNTRSDPTPGARLKLLKNELNLKMRKQKEEEWLKKQEEMKNDEVFLGEKDDCDMLPDEEDEEEMTDSEAESEPEINDVREPKKKKRFKGLFVDEEAEVEDDENAGGSNDDEDDNDSTSDDDNDNNEIDNVLEDDVECKENSNGDKETNIEKPGSLRRTLTSVSDLFASQSTEYPDSELTPPKVSWPNESKSQNSIKKLFTEPEPSSTQEKLDELAQLFGAKFNDSQEKIPGLANTSCNEESETDLMALCSGKFVTQLPRPQDLEDAGKLLNSQFLSQDSEAESSQTVKVTDEDSVDFSLKFDGDMKAGEDDDVSKEKFRLEIMSSDEDDEMEKRKTEKKKRHRKLEFSDDEEDPVPKGTSEPELSDDDSDAPSTENKKLFGIFSKEPNEVFYDSDENEIDAGTFLEKEAELSEEEDWQGSDDEDEKGLDQLEMNEADKEDIDQDLVREQLVKNHMQKMLDEDRRDVRILQEMLLEDGELHSENGGRERQFRWKNVDSTGLEDDGHRSDEENAGHDEDEDDAEWRKLRHEREMFLKEQREASKQKKEAGDLEENDDDLENSELLQLGKSVLFKCRSSSMDSSTIKEPPAAKSTVKNNLLSPDGKRNMFLTKRGSFLSRGDGVLAKLAKITGPAKENVLAGAKSSGNFVFSAISPPKKEIKTEDVESKVNAQLAGSENNLTNVHYNSARSVLFAILFLFQTGKRKAPVGLANPADKKPCLLPTARKRSGLFDHL